VVVVSFIYDGAQQKKQLAVQAEQDLAGLAPFDPYAGGFPVPPMPGQQLPPRRPVRVGAGPSRTVLPAGDGDDPADGIGGPDE
jgi:NADH-quinone oxidoreductase subunit H